MEGTTFLNASQPLRFFRKDAVRTGKPIRLSCVEIHGQNYCITDCLVKVARLEEERYEGMNDAASVVSGLIGAESAPNIFTFWQRVPIRSQSINTIWSGSRSPYCR
jgi:hypothetical protein